MAQTQLHQIIALEKGIRPRAASEFMNACNTLVKAPLLSGISRTYKPKDDDGDQLPAESTRVQVRATDVIRDVESTLTRLFDIELTKDVANSVAKADIVVDGVTIAKDVPTPFLLFLEKQLVDVLTFVTNRLPALDPAETWTYDEATDTYATAATATTRSKKVPRNHVKAEATAQHPAQVEMYYEDVLVGYWTTVKYSGALPQARINELKARVIRLAEAVKVARETANSTPVTDQKIGDKIFGYLFA
ncbi:MAG TPA: hypothetical protein VFB74_03320 [Kribbellaceae bacterium]|nr:hypothetical protein [Kribbellaceae bacterium]